MNIYVPHPNKSMALELHNIKEYAVSLEQAIDIYENNISLYEEKLTKSTNGFSSKCYSDKILYWRELIKKLNKLIIFYRMKECDAYFV